MDCDGVLWRGKTIIPGVVETLNLLRNMGKRLIFVTNNSTKTRALIQKKIQSFGIQCNQEEIFGSAYAAAVYLKSINFNKHVYVVGEESIASEMKDLGIKYRGVSEHAYIPKSVDEVADSLNPDPEVEAVVCGLDSRVSYPKIAYAHYYLTKNKNCVFLATNTDSYLPVHGKTLPGAGSIVSSLRTSTGREPIVLGKPAITLMELIIKSTGINPSRTCMVGDRLDTDILFGNEGGLKYTLLVLTGVVHEWSQDQTIIPSHIIPSLGDIASFFKAHL
uniref:4-nitrophenylphosphatase n=1 Tax=Arcella intermedia TaxID=1963864 RepID=A0A6B2LCQ5_9EUKA